MSTAGTIDEAAEHTGIPEVDQYNGLVHLMMVDKYKDTSFPNVTVAEAHWLAKFGYPDYLNWRRPMKDGVPDAVAVWHRQSDTDTPSLGAAQDEAGAYNYDAIVSFVAVAGEDKSG